MGLARETTFQCISPHKNFLKQLCLQAISDVVLHPGVYIGVIPDLGTDRNYA